MIMMVALMFGMAAQAVSSTTIYECGSHSPAISEVILDEVGLPTGEKGEISWQYQLLIGWFNPETNSVDMQNMSVSGVGRVFVPGQIGFTVFGDRHMASHGVIPNSTIVAKDAQDNIRVVIDGNTYFFTCEAKTQADY